MEKQLASGLAQIDMQSGFPWNGNVSVQVACESEETFTVALRAFMAMTDSVEISFCSVS